MADVTSAPPPTVETHDPLPEANWLWRRVFTFVFVTTMLIGMFGIGYYIHELASVDAKDVADKLYGMFRYATLLTFISVTYYMVAPSAEQVTRMWQIAALFKSGIVSSVTQTAQDTSGNTATTTTTTGPSAGPSPAPAPAPAPAYSGPPPQDIPPPHPGTPEDPSWPR